MPVELRHIRAFIAVAEDLNFRKAAERLHMAQPVLSRIVRSLEMEIGFQLFERSTRMVALTAAGRAFLPEARLVLDTLVAAVRIARRVDQGDLGTLVVGFNDFAINDSLPRIIRNFLTRYPDMEVELRSMSSPDMADALRKRRLDIGFLFGAHLVSGLKFQVLRHERLVCVLPRDHPLADEPSIDLTSLAGEPFVMGGASAWHTFIEIVDTFCMAAGFRPRVIQEAAHSDGIVNLVAAGVGVTMYVDAEWLRTRPDVVVRPFIQEVPPMTSVVAWHPDAASKAIRNFIEAADEMVRAQDGHREGR